jgi:hypothetical protein
MLGDWNSQNSSNEALIPLPVCGKSPAYGVFVLASEAAAPMIEQFNAFSELVEISKLNGSFSKNYGRFREAYRYLCSIKAGGGRSFFWAGVVPSPIPPLLPGLRSASSLGFTCNEGRTRVSKTG